MLLSITYLILAGFLAWNVLGARGKWWIKVAALVASFTFAFLFHSAVNSYKGWPISVSKPPSQAIFVSGIIDEPDQATGDPGHITLWLIPLKESRGLLDFKPSNEPRAYELAYSSKLADSVTQAQTMQKGKGNQQGQVQNTVQVTFQKGRLVSHHFTRNSLPPKPHSK